MTKEEFFEDWVMAHTSGTTILRMHECLMLMQKYANKCVKEERERIVKGLENVKVGDLLMRKCMDNTSCTNIDGGKKIINQAIKIVNDELEQHI